MEVPTEKISDERRKKQRDAKTVNDTGLRFDASVPIDTIEVPTSLQIFLSDPDVPIDTNHLERALRSIPMGRRHWLFCWTELGAKQAGIIQSLMVTCKWQGIDSYAYRVDVLQRVGQHPANQVIELTPRMWKKKFADNPLRSDLKVLGQ